MRWYVNSGGRTTGPVEEQDLAQMVKEGLVQGAAYIRDEAGGSWLELAKSPFARYATKADRRNNSIPAALSASLPPMSAALDPDDMFDHPLHLDGLASVPPKADREPPKPEKGFPKRDKAAKDMDADPFAHILSAPAPAQKAPPAMKQPSVKIPARNDTSTKTKAEPRKTSETSPLFDSDDVDQWDFEKAISIRPEKPSADRGAKPVVPMTSMPVLEIASYRPDAPTTPEPVVQDTDLATALEGPEDEAPAVAKPSGNKLRQWVTANPWSRQAVIVALGVALVVGVLWGGDRFLTARKQREQQAAAQAAAETKQRAELEAKAAADAKLLTERTTRALAKTAGWLAEIETAKGITDLSLVPKQLLKVEAIHGEAAKLASDLGAKAPAELTNVVTAAKAVLQQLKNAQKSKDAIAAALAWLRDIHQASVTVNLLKIPAEIERVTKIKDKASAMAGEFGEQVPIELSSVMPAADIALALLENAKQVLEAIAASHKLVEQGQELAAKDQWIAADKAYEEALATLDKVEVTKKDREDPLPPVLDVAREKLQVVNLRKRISHQVATEEKRIETERKQREQEQENERQAAAYRSKCGGAPTVSPFDGQIFGLQDAIRKTSNDTEPFTINKCTEPAMTKTDCWVSTCSVTGKVFGNSFRKRFAFSQQEGFKQLK